MKKSIFIIFLIFLIFILSFLLFSEKKQIEEVVSPRLLDKYAYNNLKNRKFDAGDITLGQMLKSEADFTSYIFYFTVDGKKVSGLLNIPKKEGVYPVIVMIRGYVDPKQYKTGIGTKHGGEYFTKNGFITLAPDFLGYGDSDKPAESPMEERFETYTTVLTLISSINNLNQTLKSKDINNIKVEAEKIGIWAHSNGGQIALSVLEISGKPYPTVLWAPVSKPFPYSILYYTDDADDHGRVLRKVVSDFEKDYDSEKYSLTNYLDWIKGPIQLSQGGADESVPQKWSDDLYEKLKRLKKDIVYYTYEGNDHNLSQSWSTVIARDLEFYRIKLLK